jgi:ATP-dependent exoDNAse (exonuclease V) alpha subunit
MTNDQRAAVHHILQSQDKVIGIQGDAGTGKTTVFQNIREEMEKKGYTVRGITPTGKAADVMSNEAGIKTQTVDSFLMKFSQMKIVDNKEDWKNHDKVIEKGKEVWVVDETSMMGSKEVHDLIDKAKQADARVIFCGDTKQLKSVEAGQIFKDMQQKGMNTIKMTEKVRQKDIEYKKTVDALGKKEWNTVKEKMEKQNKIKEIQNREERINEIKKDFLSGDHSKILITTATNRDKNELNSQIRNELKNQGKLGDGYKFTVRESKNLSSEEKRFAFSYSVGDTVFANRNDLQNMGIKSKTNEFVVSGVNISKNEITIKNANGKEFVINTKEHSDKFSVYQTKEIEISKNDRVITLKNDKQHGIKNGEMWQVKSIDSQGNITIKNNDKEKTINIKDYNYVDHSYAVTTHKSQGMTVNKVISDVSSQRTNYNEVYTAVTRGKTDYMIFTDNKEKFFDRMQNEQAKTTTLESTKTIELRTTEKTETKTMSSERTSTTEKTTETRDMTTSMDRGR